MTPGNSWIKVPPSWRHRLLLVLFSALSHGAAFMHVVGFYQDSPSILLQLQVLLIASFTCAAAGLLFRSRTALVYAHAFRMFLVILAAPSRWPPSSGPSSSIPMTAWFRSFYYAASR
jgi:hypothetical protein